MSPVRIRWRRSRLYRRKRKNRPEESVLEPGNDVSAAKAVLNFRELRHD
jgi:hypothetical protein